MTATPNDWDDVAIADFGEIVGGGTPSRATPSFWNGTIPWVTPTEITALRGRYVRDTGEKITLDGLAGSAAKLLPVGSVVVTTRASLGMAAIASVPLTTNQGFKSVIPNENTNSLFAYYRIQTMKSEMVRLASGTTFLEISKADFSRIRTRRPKSEEQSRIAAVLDTVDEAVAKTEAAIAKLRQVRAGLLHDLLTRGLDPNGQLRDPIAHPEQFQESPLGLIPRKWKVGSVTALAINRDAKRVPLKQADRDIRPGDYPYYGASGVIDFVDDYLFDGHFVLIGEDGENLRSRQLPLAFIVSGKSWVNNHAHVLEPFPSTDVRFLATALEAQDYTPWLLGSAQPKLTQRNLELVPLPIVPPLEQKRISDMLDIIDADIRAHESERAKLVFVKSGLMADLLAGRIRVPETIGTAS